MQGDLISRSVVLKELENIRRKHAETGREIELVSTCEKAIRELSTAYSVEKVVEELKENSKIYCEEYHQREGSLYIQDAIEIVRNGGKE